MDKCPNTICVRSIRKKWPSDSWWKCRIFKIHYLILLFFLKQLNDLIEHMWHLLGIWEWLIWYVCLCTIFLNFVLGNIQKREECNEISYTHHPASKILFHLHSYLFPLQVILKRSSYIISFMSMYYHLYYYCQYFVPGIQLFISHQRHIIRIATCFSTNTCWKNEWTKA